MFLQLRPLNVFDPLMFENNLGRSCTTSTASRFRQVCRAGYVQLAALLAGCADGATTQASTNAEFDLLFMNTLASYPSRRPRGPARAPSGERPEVQAGPSSQQQSGARGIASFDIETLEAMCTRCCAVVLGSQESGVQEMPKPQM